MVIWRYKRDTSLFFCYIKRVDPSLCSELAPVLEGSRSRCRYPRKGTSVDGVSVVFVAVSISDFLIFVKNGFVGACAEGNSVPLKQSRLLL